MGGKYQPVYSEPMIYQPGVGLHPNAAMWPWVGKVVTVLWMPPVFHMAGWHQRPNGELETVHDITWFGLVAELNKQVPACDLKPVPKKKAK